MFGFSVLFLFVGANFVSWPQPFRLLRSFLRQWLCHNCLHGGLILRAFEINSLANSVRRFENHQTCVAATQVLARTM
jgi:hypothetical protein